jgi:hypothetical protein
LFFPLRDENPTSRTPWVTIALLAINVAAFVDEVSLGPPAAEAQTLPAGMRNVKNVVCTKGAGFTTPVTQVGNFQVDEILGRVYIEADSVGINDEDVEFTFDTDASTRTQIVSGSNPIYGALRFVADNPKGENSDYYLPYVKLSPDGDYPLKGEEWMTIGFTFEILKKADNIQGAYIDGRPTIV